MINMNILNVIISLDGIDDLPEITLDEIEKYVINPHTPKKGVSKKELKIILEDKEQH